MASRSETYDKRGRAVKLARAYLRKSEDMLHLDLPIDPSYWDLLDEALDCALSILSVLPDDFFETTHSGSFLGLPGGPVNLSDTAHEHVEKIVKLLDERRKTANRNRRIALLERVEGRAPEEAVAYLAKAADLRAQQGGS